jgi:hypothetical protein
VAGIDDKGEPEGRLDFLVAGRTERRAIKGREFVHRRERPFRGDTICLDELGCMEGTIRRASLPMVVLGSGELNSTSINQWTATQRF